MLKASRIQDGAEPAGPVVIAEDVSVYVEWGGAAFRLSADEAHALSDVLMNAAIVVERRLMEAERSRRG